MQAVPAISKRIGFAACAADPGDLAALRASGCAAIRRLPRRPRPSCFEVQAGEVAVICRIETLGATAAHAVRCAIAILDAGAGLDIIDDGLTIAGSSEDRPETRLLRLLARSEAAPLTDVPRNGTGRMPKLAEHDAPQVLELVSLPGVSRAEAARRLGVGRTTLYRFLASHEWARP